MPRKPVPTRAAIPQLNIRSSFAVKRARELAKRTGSTTTKVVEEALRHYEPQSHESAAAEKERWDRIHAIMDEVAKGGPYPSRQEIEDEMYDEWGVPR